MHPLSLNLHARIQDASEGKISMEVLFESIWEVEFRVPKEELQQVNEAAYALAESQKEDDIRSLALAEVTFGIFKFYCADYPKALEYHTTGLEHFRELHDEPGIGLSLMNIGACYRSLGDLSLALEYSIEGTDKLKRANKYLKFACYGYYGIAEMYFGMTQYSESIPYYEDALAIGRKINDITGIVRSLNGMGNASLKLNDYEKALSYLQESLLLNDKDNISFQGRALNDLGNYFFETKNFQKAQEYYTKSLQLRLDHQLKDAALSSKLGIARTHMQLGEYQKAQLVLEAALSEAEQLGVKVKIFPIHQLLAEIYEAQDMLKEALEHYRLFHNIKDQVIDEKSRKRIEQMQTMHALILEKKENQSEYYRITTEQLQQQKTQIEQQHEELVTKEKQLQIAYKEAVTAEEEARQNAEEIKTVNETLAKTKNEVEELYQKEVETTKKLNQALEELKRTHRQLVHAEKMSSLGQLTAGLAHEINNPINFIYVGIQNLQALYEDVKQLLGSYTELDNEDSLDQIKAKLKEIESLKEEIIFEDFEEDMESTLRDIGTGVNRTKDIVHSLRVFSRGGEGKFEFANLHENIESTLVIINNQYKHRIEVIKNYSPELHELECNIGQLNQVIMNILVNAGHAIEGNGQVTIQTALLNGKDPEQVEISISDTGKGMTEETRMRIFEPFFTTKEVGKGTGLGLSISHGIIERHHGNIKVESEVGQGTTFIITLPRIQTH